MNGATQKPNLEYGKLNYLNYENKNHNYRNVIRNSDELCSKKMGTLSSI
jgi:hypothetical protein